MDGSEAGTLLLLPEKMSFLTNTGHRYEGPHPDNLSGHKIEFCEFANLQNRYHGSVIETPSPLM